MAFGASVQHERPIPGAVATLGVSDRVAFLRKAYGLLGVSLLVWAGATAAFFRYATETSWKFSKWALSGQLNWLLVIGLLMVSGMVAQKLARSNTSRTVQLLGLGVEVGAWTFLMQPLLWVLFLKFQPSGAQAILAQGTVATLAIFTGLTATVFITKKDFTFLRGVITVGMFAAMGIILASMLFGFTLGLVFIGAMIMLLALKILYDTSQMLNYFPPTHYVSASLMLFSTVATLFWYIINLLMEMRRN
jgi:FtsH-binding integral membrane protein